MAGLYDIAVRTINGHEGTLSPYRGKVLLIVMVCLGKIGPILKRALRGVRIGDWYGTSAIYAGADHREAA